MLDWKCSAAGVQLGEPGEVVRMQQKNAMTWENNEKVFPPFLIIP